ncbi:hypothetical protein PVV74_11805 [Roseovarius sp. SK2]|uniref:hypothetical protein n=1 Tax=Roseovarius TaxID=74030 RepID=UPI00237BF772|nr:hypothetical protein [Roseovarius sp. SK2]MDD9726142.1 hypothetical protein [Roseovarius sp. SK2]
MADAPTTLVGVTVAIAASVPATEDASAYGAISTTEIGKVLSVPETGNTSNAGTVTLLKNGVTQHYNGSKVVAPFTIPYVYDLDDAGQAIVRANENGTTECTLEITDPDGDVYYIQGVIGSVMQAAREPDAYKGESFEFRSITLFTKVDGGA